MNENETYTGGTNVKYSCTDDSKEIVENRTVTCLYNAKWTDPPLCVPKSESHKVGLVIVLPTILTITVLIILMIVIITIKRHKRMKMLLRNTRLHRVLEYDAFISFHFDKNHEFVENVIVPALEEYQDPPFKLCIHSEDFVPGSNILNNITEGITSSKTAIIVLSQEFIDSPWCQKEFEYCIVENINDPAFRLLVILMEKLDKLQNLSPNMNNFMKQKTHLERK